jgi:hypothetical protein
MSTFTSKLVNRYSRLCLHLKITCLCVGCTWQLSTTDSITDTNRMDSHLFSYCIVGNFRGVQFSRFSQISGYPRKLDPRNKYDCTVYNGHDCTRPRKLKLGPHENFPLYSSSIDTQIHVHGSMLAHMHYWFYFCEYPWRAWSEHVFQFLWIRMERFFIKAAAWNLWVYVCATHAWSMLSCNFHGIWNVAIMKPIVILL